MTQQDREIAKELKNKLSEVVHLLDFRVFGSRARGDADEYFIIYHIEIWHYN